MEVDGDFLGESPAMMAVREKLSRLLQLHAESPRLPPILIQGETGTEKGGLARLIHRSGPRADAPFVEIDCAAIREILLEAKLFGFERGVYTSDVKEVKDGLFQAAHGGTIFLDEVGLLSETVQAKLLRVIEGHTVRRLGSTHSEPVDVSIITATSEDLVDAPRRGRFREDLYRRLAAHTLWLPPLRDRGQDVIRLAEHFLSRACSDYHLRSKTLAHDARAALLAYQWPGNIRQLANVIELGAVLEEGLVVSASMLGLPESRSGPGPPGA
jgi:two-component system, NtrC family, response regulator AtoC